MKCGRKAESSVSFASKVMRQSTQNSEFRDMAGENLRCFTLDIALDWKLNSDKAGIRKTQTMVTKTLGL